MDEIKWFDVVQTIEKVGTIDYYYNIVLTLITAFQNEHIKTKKTSEDNHVSFEIGEVKGEIYKIKNKFTISFCFDHGFDNERIIFDVEVKFTKSKGIYSIKEITESKLKHYLDDNGVGYYQGYIFITYSYKNYYKTLLNEYNGKWYDVIEGTNFTGDSILNKVRPNITEPSTCLEEKVLSYIAWKIPVFFHLHSIGKLDEFVEATKERKFEIIRENSTLITYDEKKELTNWGSSEINDRVLCLKVLPSKYTKYLIDEYPILKLHFYSMENGVITFLPFSEKFGIGMTRLTIPIDKLKDTPITRFDNSIDLIELGEFEFTQNYFKNNELKES